MALPANALIAVATLETELGLVAGSETALLERGIGIVSTAIEAYLDRKLRSAEVVERVKGTGAQRLLLSRTPIDEEADVVVQLDDMTFDESSYYVEDAEAGFLFRSVGWPNTARMSAGAQPELLAGTEEKSLEVTYTGGYALADVPLDIQQAAIICAVAWYRGRGKYQRLAEETVDGDTTKPWYDYLLPPNARQLLTRHRRVA